MDDKEEFRELCRLLLRANRRHIKLLIIYLKKMLRAD